MGLKALSSKSDGFKGLGIRGFDGFKDLSPKRFGRFKGLNLKVA